MSSFTIRKSASVTLLDRAGSLSRISSSRMAGTICQRRPNRSMSQPQAARCPAPIPRIAGSIGSGHSSAGYARCVEERDALVVVGAFTGMDEAAVARGALEQEGIETFLANEHMVTLVWTLSQATGGVRLSVASKDAESARKILGSAADANAAIQDDAGGRIAADEDEPIPAADELVERAWKSSLLAFLAFPPLLHLWAPWPLRRAYSAAGPRTERGRTLA